MRFRSSPNDRGATLVEYALGIALVVVVSLGAIQSLEDESTAELDEGAAARGVPTEQLNIPANAGNIIGGGVGSTVGSGAADVHVLSLSGEATTDTSTTGNTDWLATVTISVKNLNTTDLWAGVTVTGHFRYDEVKGNGQIQATRDVQVTCVTTDEGLCAVQVGGLDKSGNNQVLSVTFDTVALSGPSGGGIVFTPQSGDPTSVGPILRPS